MTSREIVDVDEIERYADRMFRAVPLPYLTTVQQMNAMTWYMRFGVWTLIENVGLNPQWADEYRQAHGSWNHGNGRTESHNRLGESWAWWAINEGGLNDVVLSDSPDITARIEDKQLIGDVGQCSFLAWMDGANSLGFHDIWVSVLDYDTQMVVEPNINLSALSSARISYRLGISTDIDRHIHDVFWCKQCGLYHAEMDWVRTWFSRWIN